MVRAAVIAGAFATTPAGATSPLTLNDAIAIALVLAAKRRRRLCVHAAARRLVAGRVGRQG